MREVFPISCFRRARSSVKVNGRPLKTRASLPLTLALSQEFTLFHYTGEQSDNIVLGFFLHVKNTGERR